MLWNDIVPVWYYCLPVCSDGHKSYPYQLCGRCQMYLLYALRQENGGYTGLQQYLE